MKPAQTVVFLLVFMAVAITVTTAAVIILITNSQAGSRLEQGYVAYDVAESGIENALMRLLRDPDYADETLSVGTGQATITVSGGNPKTVLSTGVAGNYFRQIQVMVTFTGGTMNIAPSSWREIF